MHKGGTMTVSEHSTIDTSSPVISQELRTQLHAKLLVLPLSAFEQLVLKLIRQSGYANAHLAERMDRRGRTLVGGLDLKAYCQTDIAQSLTIAQVKRYTSPVPRRFVDELRGTMLRTGAKHGLLMTTSVCSKAAHQAASAIPLLPITILEREDLLNLLIDHQIGVEQQTVQRLVLSDEFFQKLSG
jgi:restriction system protein